MIRKYYMVACYCIGILLCWFSVRYMVDGSVASVGPEDSTRTARYESVKVGRSHGHRLEMPLELLRAWGDMAHVVKGMWERQIGHSSLEREICLAGLNKWVKEKELQSLYNAEHGGFHWSLFPTVFL